jgi:hypothetical protein
MSEYRVKPGGMHEKALASRNKIQIVGGGFGNGKTALACIKGIRLAKDYPGSNGIIAMATYAQLNDTIREEFYKWIPHSWVDRWPTIANNTLIMKNGSKVNFRYLQQKGRQQADGQTSSNLLSATYDWAIVDQIENPAITYKDFLDLLGRLRGNTKYKGDDPTMPLIGPRWLILTANPAFNWVFHKLIKPMEIYRKTGEKHPDLIVYQKDPDDDTETDFYKDGEPLIDLFEASTYENKHNLGLDFIRTLEAAYTGQFRARYLGGEWGAFEGLVYPTFAPEVHLVDQDDIMRYLFRMKAMGIRLQAFQGFDFGLAVPSCYCCGFLTPMGMPIIVDGYYRPSADPDQDGFDIQRIQGRLSPYIDFDFPILADPAIFKRTMFKRSGGGATTIASVLTNDFGLFIKRGQNDIISGIAKVSSYLNVREMPNPLTGEKVGPAIMFAKHLSFIADEFGSYFWKTGPDNVRIDTPIDRNDHFLDQLKYSFSYLPPANQILFNVQLPQGKHAHAI